MTRSITHSPEFYEKKRLAIAKPTKVCKRCGIEKSKSEFTTSREHKDGKHPICNECKKKDQREAYKREPNRFYKNVLKWLADNPEKRNAHIKVRQAVISGKLVKPKTCQECGMPSNRLDAHHWKGYDKEHVYDVRWLCRSCHKKA